MVLARLGALHVGELALAFFLAPLLRLWREKRKSPVVWFDNQRSTTTGMPADREVVRVVRSRDILVSAPLPPLLERRLARPLFVESLDFSVREKCLVFELRGAL